MNRLTHAAVPLALLALLLTSPLAVARLGPNDGQLTAFTCADGTEVYVRCTEKKEKDGVQLCMGDDFKGKDMIYTAKEGYSPCNYTTCLGVYCEDPNNIFTSMMQLYSFSGVYNTFPSAPFVGRCMCYNPKGTANGVGCTAADRNCPDPLKVRPGSPSYPTDNEQCTANYKCPLPDSQVLQMVDDKCICCSGIDAFNPKKWQCDIEAEEHSGGVSSSGSIESPSPYALVKFFRDAFNVDSDGVSDDVIIANEKNIACIPADQYPVREQKKLPWTVGNNILCMGAGQLYCEAVFSAHKFCCSATMHADKTATFLNNTCHIDAVAGPVAARIILGAVATVAAAMLL